MKSEILRIIQSKVRIQKARTLAGTDANILEGEELAADELTALMCYREVKAFCGAFVNGQGCTALEMANKYLLKQGYSIKDIEIAIEQVKTEQK